MGKKRFITTTNWWCLLYTEQEETE